MEKNELLGINGYSSITTDFLYIIGKNNNKIELKPGFNILLSFIIRNGADKIYIPNRKYLWGKENLNDLIKDLPIGVQSKIEIYDKDGKLLKKVRDFLKPVFDISVETPNLLIYNFIEDYLYKILISSKTNSEADISMIYQVYALESFSEKIREESEEASYRIDEIIALSRLYSDTDKINILLPTSGISQGYLYDKISNLMTNTKIKELSMNRHLLGIPSKSLIAYNKINKLIDDYVSKNPLNWVIGGWEFIKYVKKDFNSEEVNWEIVKKILGGNPTYNPPIVNLDYYRTRVCQYLYPNSLPNFMIYDNSTRFINPENMDSFQI